MQISTAQAHQRWAVTALLFLLTLEVALLGSGRLLEVGPVTARMLLYFVALCCSVVMFCLRRSVPVSTCIMLMAFIAISSLSALVGILNLAHLELIAEDVKPLGYVLLLPFFEAAIDSYSRFRMIARTIQAAAVVMAVSYLLIFGAVVTGFLSFASVYYVLGRLSEQDIFFRGESGVFFYKGFLYLCAGVILFAFGKSRISKILATVLFAAILATGTRGFVLGFIGVFAIYLCVWSKHRMVGWATVLLACALGPTYLAASADRSISDATRLVTTRQVVDEIGLGSVLQGHGLGVGVSERPVHMEISYLEIFHKQGLLGLTWWLCLFMTAVCRFRRTERTGTSNEALPFFLCALFVFIESVTNPYVNNPIGLSLLLICLAAMRFLGKSGHTHVNAQQYVL